MGLIWLGFMSERLNDDNLDLFNGVGWFLLAVNYLFNAYFLVMTILCLVDKCRGEQRIITEDRQRELYDIIVEENLTPKQMGRLVVKGNLNNADCKTLPDF
jgi:hypothetical protein